MSSSALKIPGAQPERRERFLASTVGDVFCVGASAVSYYLAIRHIDLWPFALFAPLPMLAAAFAAPTRSRAMLLAFIPIFLGSFGEWSAESFFLPVPIFVAIGALSGIIIGLLVLVARGAARTWTGWTAALVFPILYAALSFILARTMYDGTWADPAYRMDTLRPLLQLASITGLWGIVFAMSIPASALALAWYRVEIERPWITPTAVGLGVFAAVMIFGFVRLATSGPEPRVHVAMIASDHEIKYSRTTDEAQAADLLGFYASQVPKAAAKGAQVVVMPEKIVGVTDEDRAALQKILSDAASASHVWIVAGVNEVGRTPKVNAAWIFDDNGKFVGEYDKHYFVRGFEAGYQPGASIFTFDAPWGKTGVAICKDLDYPWFIRHYGAEDIRLMLVPAWDWEGPNALMHERMSWVRGVENGFATARSAKTGYVTAHCAYGSSFASDSTFAHDPAIVVTDVPLGPGATFYTRHGDWFGWLSIIASIAILIAVFTTRADSTE
jgi:apolipoprotein N-acyltransferase